MPMYEYRCHKCGQSFELIQRFSDPELKIHEDCGGELEKLVSAPAFHLKGSGWYATDYAKGSGTNPASKPAGDTAAKTDGDSDSKPSKDAKPSKTESTPAPTATPASTSKDSSTK